MKKIKEYILNLNYTQISLIIAYIINMLVPHDLLNMTSGSSNFWTGLIFGIVAYGTWSLTNMAVLKGWSPIVTFIDITWGGFLTSTSSALSVFIVNKLI